MHVVFVQCHATEDYVKQFLFCCPLAKDATGKKYLSRFFYLRNISFRGSNCVSVCTDGASAMITKKIL